MLSVEQAEQRKTRNKQVKTHKNTKNRKHIPLDEAKKEVFALLQAGWTYRRISQRIFYITGLGLKRFSLSEINKIKNEFAGGNHNNSNNSCNSNGDKSEIFRLIKNGVLREDIVILTGQDPTFVKNAYKEYMDLKNLVVLPSDEIIELLAKKGIVVHNPNSLKQVIARMADSYQFLYHLEYNCNYCKKPVPLSPYRDNKDWLEDLVDALYFLSKNNVHHECLPYSK